MGLFESPALDGHEHVSFFVDPSVGLRAIIAIHRTGPLGIAGGGCRMWPYRDGDEAMRDALRLSRAMTYKMALYDLPAGGAKAVVWGDPARDKSEGLLRALGRAIERLGGRFIVSEDVGTTPADMAVVARETLWVNPHGDASADTAGPTARAVFGGIEVAARRRLGRGLDGVRVAVQGLGHVGRCLAGMLAAAGARLVVSDLDRALVDEAVASLGARTAAPEAIATEEVEVFAPCALADALDAPAIPRLRCAVVAGSANNPLADDALAEALAARGILYAPDIAINAGGAIAAAFGAGGDEAQLAARLVRVPFMLDRIFERAEAEGVTPLAAAERLARERMAAEEPVRR